MKKRYLFLIIGIFLTLFFNYSVEKRSVNISNVFAPNTLKLDSNAAINNIIGNISYVIYVNYNSDNVPFYSLMKNTEGVSNTEKIENIDGNPETITDKGLSYIINHGYNNKNSYSDITGTTNNDEKYFVTQMAIWLYIYENKATLPKYCISTDNGYSTCDFVDGAGNLISSANIRNAINSNDSNYLKSIIKLVDNAKSNSTIKINNISLSDIDYSFKEDEKIVTTSLITPSLNTSSNFKYSISINNPKNYKIEVLNDSSKVINPVNITGGFRIKISYEDIDKLDLSSISVVISTNVPNNKSITDFRVTGSTKPGPKSDTLITAKKNQRFPNLVYGEEISTPISTKFSLYNVVRLRKVDKNTRALLKDAKLEIKDSSDKVILNLKTTGEILYLNLNPGTYKVCEVEAPDGYEKLDKCIDFTVDGTSITTVNVENNAIIIPDTFMGALKISYFLGMFSIAGGIIMFIYVILKGKKRAIKES